MLHNANEIREFDSTLAGIQLHLGSANNHDVVTSVSAVMRLLFWHDWVEWNQLGGPWIIADDSFEAFDADDRERARSVALSAVTVLKSNGKSGVPVFQRTSREYLSRRGVDTSPVIVTTHDIARVIGISPGSIPPAKKREWGHPIRIGTRGKPAEWNRDTLLPILMRQWPDKPWEKL